MNRIIPTVFYIIILHIVCLKVNGNACDTTVASPTVGINLYSGMLMYHHKEMEILREKPVRALEFSWILVGNGSKLWHKAYRYPEFGVSYMLIDLGSPSILGYSHSVIPFISFPLSKSEKQISANFRAGSGLAYVTKVYHRTNNFKNSAISTHLNANISFTLEGKISITPNLTARMGYQLNHFSNGTFRKPNAGLNYTMFSLGISHSLNSHKTTDLQQIRYSDNPNRLLLMTSGSYKEAKNAGGPKYGVGSLSIELSRSYKTLWRYGISMDFMYDQSAGYIMDYENIPWNNQWDILKTGTTLNFEMIFDQLSAVFYFGKYIHNKSEEGGPVYQRIGLRYRLFEHYWLHLALKTHWGKADYVEFGVGIKIF